MISADVLKRTLCETFCSALTVNPVPCGYAVSTIFEDRSSDSIGCLVIEDEGGYRIEDDGEYLAHLIGSGIEIDRGARKQLLEAILAQGQASWDSESLVISSGKFATREIGDRLVRFISSLIRVRDLELLTRELVRSTLRQDVTAALKDRFGATADFEENSPVDAQFPEFPSDLVIHPRTGNGAMKGALYFATSNEKLSEALLLLFESRLGNREDFKVFAVLEDAEMRAIGKRQFQRAQNRSLPMPIFRQDEAEAVNFIARDLNFPA